MLLVLDNYDSFTYNLVQYLRGFGEDVRVYRNDKIAVTEIDALNPAGIILSPGPGNPDTAGITLDTIKYFAGKKPILGVCLGHQSIVQSFGGRIVHAQKIMHGKTSKIATDGKGVFTGIASPFDAMRYHSLAADRATFPSELIITAEADDDKEIMGCRHKTLPIEGIQFHPESIMTTVGKRLLRNFIQTLQ